MDVKEIVDSMTDAQRQAVDAITELWATENEQLRARIAELEADKIELTSPLVEMVGLMESGDEAGSGSDWFYRAMAAIDAARG